MTGEIQEFVEMVVNKYPMKGRVLEVGSRDYAGSAKRWFTKDGLQKEPTERFPEYIGIDRDDGNLVDIVMSAYDLAEKFGSESFDVVISCDSCEHDLYFWKTLKQIEIVMKPGAYFIWTVPSWIGNPPHMEEDYYRFMVKAGGRLLGEWMGLEVLELIDSVPGNAVFALGRKINGL